jgi:hypothetical protein
MFFLACTVTNEMALTPVDRGEGCYDPAQTGKYPFLPPSPFGRGLGRGPIYGIFMIR